MDVLYEDNHLLVINKPAGLATMGAVSGEPSAVELAKEYLKQKYQKPGNVFIGVVSRLDLVVTGVLVMARTSKAASRLSAQFRENRITKKYWCLTPHTPETGRKAQCSDWLIKSEALHRMVITEAEHPQAKIAKMHYRTIAKFPRAVMLEVEPETGRKHQIRVQLAARGAPILGDRKYESGERFPDGVALHARELTLNHPTLREEIKLTAPIPASWHRWAQTLGYEINIE